MPRAAARKTAPTPNHHHSLVGGLHADRVELDELVRSTAEAMDIEDWRQAYATDELIAAAKAYDTALAAALDELVLRHPPVNGAKADALWDAEGPYVVLMMLEGQSPDGDWAEFYPGSAIEPVKRFLRDKLASFADDKGCGSLEDAIADAADETCPDEEDDSEDPDEDEEDDPDSEEESEDDEE